MSLRGPNCSNDLLRSSCLKREGREVRERVKFAKKQKKKKKNKDRSHSQLIQRTMVFMNDEPQKRKSTR